MKQEKNKYCQSIWNTKVHIKKQIKETKLEKRTTISFIGSCILAINFLHLLSREKKESSTLESGANYQQECT